MLGAGTIHKKKKKVQFIIRSMQQIRFVSAEATNFKMCGPDLALAYKLLCYSYFISFRT